MAGTKRQRTSRALKGLALGLWMIAGATACKAGSPPTIVDPGNQVAIVGETMILDLFASDPDGDDLTYSFRAAGVENITSYAQIGRAPDGHGVFTFQPIAGQEGTHIFDFIVSDGKFDTILPLTIEIRGASGSESSPIFRDPQAGVVLNLTEDPDDDCASFDILVEDADSTEIELSVVPPSIPGADLDAASNGLEGTWRWCPDRDQREQFQYRVTLSADDHDNPATLKDIPIVLRRPSGEGCPGEAPAIDHSPRDFETLLDLEIVAEVTDDQGLKSPPFIYYAYEDPRGSSGIEWGSLMVANMSLESGDMRRGTWSGSIPNPTVEDGIGTTATVYYIIEVVDDDDAEGECDHRTDSPSDGTHVVGVENTGDGGAGVCEACSYDVQCGSDSDLCIQLENGTVCGQSCSGDDCPEGYACSSSPMTSVDGASGRQCEPEGGQCGGGMTPPDECTDDGAEPDDNPEEARNYSPITGSYTGNAKLCPNDQDWFFVSVSEETQVSVTLSGDSPPDMDLSFTNSSGQEIDASVEVGSDEQVDLGCLDPGEYFAVAYIYDSEAGLGGNYTLDFDLDASACQTASACCEEQESGGCPDMAIETCVCDSDPFCCSNTWDATCISKAINECSASCTVDNPGAGDCCAANGTAGCEYDAVEECVCFWNSECCAGATWDAPCASTAATSCGC